jgi:threonine/homoserine/homoserine lactone efflux protein
MPTAGTLIAFSLAALVLIVVPGPNIVYIVARGVEQGRQAAVFSALLASSQLAFDTVRYLSAAYLLYLGLRTFARRDGTAADADETGAPTLASTYRQAVLVNVLNPKVALFFLAFLPQFIDPARGPAWAQILVLGVVFLLIGLCLDLSYATAAGTIGHWLKRRPRALRWQRYTSGSVYLALGAAAALSGSRR